MTGEGEASPTHDLPLGVAPNPQTDTARIIATTPGDAIVLLTGGFFERANERGDQWGAARARDCVARGADERPAVLAEALVAESD